MILNLFVSLLLLLTPTIMQIVKNDPRPLYTCKRCREPLTTRRKRGLLLKTALFWLPIRKFFCERCLKTRYVM
jgi:uncharacterized protein YlaI